MRVDALEGRVQHGNRRTLQQQPPEQGAAALAARQKAQTAAEQMFQIERAHSLCHGLAGDPWALEQRARGGALVDGVVEKLADVVTGVGLADLLLDLE